MGWGGLTHRGGMPGTGSPLEDIQATFVRAQLTKAYPIGGRAYIDAHMAMGGQSWKTVPVVELGGGEGRYLYTPMAGDQGDGKPVFSLATQSDPSAAASAQVLLLFDNISPFPVCIGAIQHDKRGLLDATPVTEDATDRPAGIGHQDIAASNGGSTYVLDSEGVFAVMMADGKPYQVQLSESGGRLRISRGGEADEKLLLGNATLGYLDDLEASVKQLITRLNDAERIIDIITSQIALGIPVVGGGGGAATIVAFLDVRTQAAAGVISQKFTDIDTRVVASTVEISEKSLKDEP